MGPQSPTGGTLVDASDPSGSHPLSPRPRTTSPLGFGTPTGWDSSIARQPHKPSPGPAHPSSGAEVMPERWLPKPLVRRQ